MNWFETSSFFSFLICMKVFQQEDVELFSALLPQTMFSFNIDQSALFLLHSVLKDRLQATQNYTRCRSLAWGAMLLWSVLVFKWVFMSIAEIQVYALIRWHTECFGWRNGHGWTVLQVWAHLCVSADVSDGTICCASDSNGDLQGQTELHLTLSHTHTHTHTTHIYITCLILIGQLEQSAVKHFRVTIDNLCI